MAELNPTDRVLAFSAALADAQEEMLQTVEGIPLPRVKGESFSYLQSKFTVRSTDVFIDGYPKAGSTWLAQIVKLIHNNGVENGIEVAQVMPMVEFLTAEEAEAISSPRTFKSHLPYHLCLGGEPATTFAKYIYIYRNPKDVAVSYYYYLSGFQFYPSFPWDVLFEVYLEGSKIAYGPMLEHVAGWWKHRDAKNILFLNYESMHNDLPGTIQTIADFLGYSLNPETNRKITEQTSFATMKKNPAANSEFMDKYRREKSAPFMRKGVVGDWRTFFTAEQSARMDEKCAEIFAGSGLEFDYGL